MICPFCGERERLRVVDASGGGGKGFAVHCSGCAAMGPIGDTREDAIVLWGKGPSGLRRGSEVLEGWMTQAEFADALGVRTERLKEWPTLPLIRLGSIRLVPRNALDQMVDRSMRR